MFTKLIVLGGGGWFPAHGRQTCCTLLVNGDSAIMIDAGTGVGRLVERPDLLDGIQRLDILLTHFHLDHVSGLAYLPAIGLRAETVIWGPGRELYGTPTRELLWRLGNEPFHPVPFERQDIHVQDIPPGAFELAGATVATRRQDRHSAPTFGFRFGDDLAWVTDTAHDPQSAKFAQGCALLAHETWFTEDEPRTPEVHTSAAQAASVAAEAGIERMLMIHLPPFTAGVEALSGEARSVLPGAVLAEDGLELSLLGERSKAPV